MGQTFSVFEETDELPAVVRVVIEIGADITGGRPPCTQSLRFDGGNVITAL